MKSKLHLINGPLGAGKTTLLKFLLQQPQLHDAQVIENEFASTSIDTEALHDHINEVETIAGLCICCSTGTELVDALLKLKESGRPVIIEATGVANSLKLIEKLAAHSMLDHYDVAQAFFVIDAVEASNDPLILETHKAELEAADVVCVSKTDLLDTKTADAILEKIATITSGAVVATSMGAFDASIIDRPSQFLNYFVQSDAKHTNHDTNMNYTIIETGNEKLEAKHLQYFWTTSHQQYALKRMKGNFVDQAGTHWHIEATPSQCIVTQQKNSETLQLVLIGADARSVSIQTLKEIQS